ncbi:MAG: dockerin type I domain-containing protein [Candidatus Omnitrophota bacterium]
MRKIIFFPVLFFLLLISVRSEATMPLVKVEDQRLMTDFDQDGVYSPYFIKGVGYSPVPVGRPGMQWGGSNIFDDERILRRDFQFLHDMNANTIRIWKADNTNNFQNEFPTYITDRTLNLAVNYGLRVIPGFWIEFGGYWQCGQNGREFIWDQSFFDLENRRIHPAVREDILARWRDFVNEFQDHPGILFWSIGNENNYQLGDDEDLVRAFYELIEEMALYAHDQDALARPVAFVNGDLTVNVDRSGQSVDIFPEIVTNITSSIDVWGVNAYRGESFEDLFERFNSMIGDREKALWVAEFGLDAWHSDPLDPDGGYEDQETQAAWTAGLWDEIVAVKDQAVCGGTVMAYVDEWWKPDQWLCRKDGWEQWWEPFWRLLGGGPDDACGSFNSTHDLYGFGPTDENCDGQIVAEEDWIPPAPDQFFNEEWWGIMRVIPALSEDEIDTLEPRKVYQVLAERFDRPVYNAPPQWEIEVADQQITAGEVLTFTLSAADPDGDELSYSARLAGGGPLSEIGASLTDQGDGEAEFRWPANAQWIDKTVNVVFTVQDPADGTAEQTVRISVNRPDPVITALSADEAFPGEQIIISGRYFGTYQADQRYDAAADFNADGVVDNIDRIFFNQHIVPGFNGRDYDPRVDLNYNGEADLPDIYAFIGTYRRGRGPNSVEFLPGIQARILSWTDTQIVCVVPYGVETGEVRVKTSAGMSGGIAFRLAKEDDPIDGIPVIEQVSPSAVGVGEIVTITGENFAEFDGDSRYDMSADFNRDGIVDSKDSRILMASWRETVDRPDYDIRADANRDGVVGMADLYVLIRHFHSRVGDDHVVIGADVWPRIISWSPTEIRCIIPAQAVSGPIRVVSAEKVSNSVPITIQP